MLVLNEIAGNFKTDDRAAMDLVDTSISFDNALIDTGILPSYHAYMVCQKTTSELPMQTQSLSPDVLAASYPLPGRSEEQAIQKFRHIAALLEQGNNRACESGLSRQIQNAQDRIVTLEAEVDRCRHVINDQDRHIQRIENRLPVRLYRRVRGLIP